ncbi:MAG: hypothetical protein AAF617_09295, partial [Bacteroidota bacterium]
LQLDYSHEQEAIPAVLLKGRKLFSKQSNSVKNLILISDFQQNETLQVQTDSTFTTNYIQLRPANANNIALDSLYIAEQDANSVKISVVLKNSGVPVQDVPVSLYDGESLIAKSSVNLDSQNSAEVSFSIPSNKVVQGNIRIDDTSLQFDNNLYFNINKPEKINVLAINESEDEFLQKLYTENEFNLISVPLNQLNYNDIATQQLIVLNELKTIPNPLITALKSFKQNGGSLVVIPSTESNIDSYNQLLDSNKENFWDLIEVPNTTEKKITKISFDHPLFTNVFEKEVTNFQYPKVNQYYAFIKGSNAILRFENSMEFLVEDNNTYVFTAAINRENSNFQNSPLIVPIFYNIAKNSLRLTNLYYTLGRENVVDVQTSLGQDAVLTIANAEEEFIPLQQTTNTKVRLTTDEFPSKAGIYNIKNQNADLQQISYNFDRTESNLQYHNIATLYPENTHTTVAQFFEELKNEQSVASLWKWFVIFALVFLGIEMLILKFVT